jgi:hypothetical protein
MSLHISPSSQTPTQSHERPLAEKRSLERMEAEPNHSFASLGFWAAIAGAAGAIIYGVNSMVIGFALTPVITWHNYTSFLASYNPWITAAVLIPAFAVTFIFPVLIFAIYQSIPEGSRRLAGFCGFRCPGGLRLCDEQARLCSAGRSARESAA